MGLLDQLFKSFHESNLGRIRWGSNMWALTGGRWDSRRVSSKALVGTANARYDASGELHRVDDAGLPMVLVKRQCVHCPRPGPEALTQLSAAVSTAASAAAPAPVPDARPAFAFQPLTQLQEYAKVGKWWSVPKVECVKCKWHKVSVKGAAGRRYPCCGYGRGTQAQAALQTLEQVSGMVGKAMGEAERVVRGEEGPK